MSVRAHGLTASDEKLTEVRCSYAPVADGVPKLRNLEQIPSTSFDASPVSSSSSSSSSICVRPFGLNFSSFNSSLSSSESSDVVSKPAPKRKAIESQADVPFKKRKENLKIYPSSIDDDNNNNNDENGENVGDKDRRDLEVTTEPTALLGMTSKEKTQSDVGNDEFSMEIDAFRYALAESESPDDVDGKSGKGDDSTATSETKESADDVTPSTLISLGTGPGETDDEEAASRDIMDLDLDVFVDVCEVVAQMVVNVEGQDADDDGQDAYDVKGDQENDGDSEENDDENDDGSEDDDDEPASLEEAERLRQTIVNLKEECARLRAEKRRIEEEEEERKRERDRLAAEIRRAKEEFARLRAECDRLKRNLAKQEEEIARLRLFLMIARERRRKATMVEE